VNWFQDSIFEHLHHHNFSNMLYMEMPNHAHWTCILSCFDLRVGTSKFTTQTYQLNVSIVFSNFLHGALNYPLFNCKLSLMCVHLVHSWSNGHSPFVMSPWQQVYKDTWCNFQQCLCIHCLRGKLPCGTRTLHVLTLVTPNSFHWHCHFKRWGLHFRWCCHSRFNKDRRKSTILFKLKFCHLKTTHAKQMSYHDQHPTYQFFLLSIKVYSHFHKQMDIFSHECANVAWVMKGLKGLLVFILVIFLHQRISITFQKK
jgi:hypothetical protein